MTGHNEEGANRALIRALHYLGIKDRSRGEVFAYLKGKGHPEEEIREAIGQLEKAGHLDDEHLAVSMIARAGRKEIGRSRLMADMLSRGIERDIVEDTLNRYYPEDEFSLALPLVLKQWERFDCDEEERERKLAAWMRRRGYSTSTIVKALRWLGEASAIDGSP
jgi:regulatory protein